MRNQKASQLVKRLRRLGWSKWAISKKLGVSWQTVYCWSRDNFQPSPERWKQLKQLQRSKP